MNRASAVISYLYALLIIPFTEAAVGSMLESPGASFDLRVVEIVTTLAGFTTVYLFRRQLRERFSYDGADLSLRILQYLLIANGVALVSSLTELENLVANPEASFPFGFLVEMMLRMVIGVNLIISAAQLTQSHSLPLVRALCTLMFIGGICLAIPSLADIGYLGFGGAAIVMGTIFLVPSRSNPGS